MGAYCDSGICEVQAKLNTRTMTREEYEKYEKAF